MQHDASAEPVMPQDTKSPLKAPSLRVPGESIDAQLGEVEYDEIISPLALALFLALLAALEWYRYLSHQPPSPWTFTAAAIIGVAWAVWRAVLEPKALDAFIERQPIALSHDQVRAMSSAPSSYIRSQAASQDPPFLGRPR
jgi:hypothetical protein